MVCRGSLYTRRKMGHPLMEGLHPLHLVCWETMRTWDRHPTGLFSFIYKHTIKFTWLEWERCITMAKGILMVMIHLQIWPSYKKKLKTKPDHLLRLIQKGNNPSIYSWKVGCLGIQLLRSIFCINLIFFSNSGWLCANYSVDYFKVLHWSFCAGYYEQWVFWFWNEIGWKWTVSCFYDVFYNFIL